MFPFDGLSVREGGVASIARSIRIALYIGTGRLTIPSAQTKMALSTVEHSYLNGENNERSD